MSSRLLELISPPSCQSKCAVDGSRLFVNWKSLAKSSESRYSGESIGHRVLLDQRRDANVELGTFYPCFLLSLPGAKILTHDPIKFAASAV